jgi:hypothetical protein
MTCAAASATSSRLAIYSSAFVSGISKISTFTVLTSVASPFAASMAAPNSV